MNFYFYQTSYCACCIVAFFYLILKKKLKKKSGFHLYFSVTVLKYLNIFQLAIETNFLFMLGKRVGLLFAVLSQSEEVTKYVLYLAV